MALKRSAGVGTVTLCVVLVGGNEASGHGLGDGVVVGHDRRTSGPRAGGRHAEDPLTIVARRGFGASGRKTAPSSSE